MSGDCFQMTSDRLASVVASWGLGMLAIGGGEGVNRWVVGFGGIDMMGLKSPGGGWWTRGVLGMGGAGSGGQTFKIKNSTSLRKIFSKQFY